MKGLIATIAGVGVLLVAATSVGAEPPGFWENKRLEPAASFVAGKPATVYCAYKQATIDAAVSATATNTVGATPVIGGGVIYISPAACAYLNAWLNGRKVANLYGVAVSMETLAHEAELAGGVADETTATCVGLKRMPQMVTRFFPLKKRESLHDLMADAYDAWAQQSSAYHAHPC